MASTAFAQAHYDLLIKNGHVIDAKNGISAVRDVAIANHKIAAVAANIPAAQATKVIDASGLYVTPGLVDIHVHVYAGTGQRNAYSGDNSETMAFKTDWLATVTGRIGYAITPQALLYAKGGAAWVHTKYTDTDPSGVTFPPFSGQGSATLNGWTVGGGLEYAFWPNWSVFPEYDYVGLNTPTVSLSYNCAAPCGFTNPYPYQENHHFQMVLLGLNYRFGIGLGR